MKPEPVSQFDPSDDSQLHVVVHVTDQNDNSPKFSRPVFTGGISTDIEYGTEIMAVEAEDADMGENAVLEYRICGEVEHSGYEGAALNTTAAFLLHPTTGNIRLNFDPQRDQKGYFSFPVCVADRGGRRDTAQVRIYLLREDQRVMFVVRSHPEEVK